MRRSGLKAVTIKEITKYEIDLKKLNIIEYKPRNTNKK